MVHEALTLTENVDERRRVASCRLNPTIKAIQGQFLTPRAVAAFMASLFSAQYPGTVRLLDVGAGIGSLTTAFVDAWPRA